MHVVTLVFISFSECIMNGKSPLSERHSCSRASYFKYQLKVTLNILARTLEYSKL